MKDLNKKLIATSDYLRIVADLNSSRPWIDLNELMNDDDDNNNKLKMYTIVEQIQLIIMHDYYYLISCRSSDGITQ
jgi:hypothetical protein